MGMMESNGEGERRREGMGERDDLERRGNKKDDKPEPTDNSRRET